LGSAAASGPAPAPGSGPGASGPGSRGGVAFLVAQVGAHAAARFAARLSDLDLAPPHAGILRLLGASPGVSQQALAELLGSSASRLVALVDELAERGLVERRNDPRDRRAYSLHLTALGRRQLQEIGRLAREHQDALCAALGAAEREQLASLLRRIADEQGLTPLVHPGYRSLRRPASRRDRGGRDAARPGSEGGDELARDGPRRGESGRERPPRNGRRR
jgi:DNA-binding MarR family transcriptional regulator